jgi:N-acetyl-gamma-glutamyl-phosphate reductase
VREVVGARVAVAGASGYAGGELLRLLAAHPDLEIGPVSAGLSAGRRVSDLHPHLASLAGHVFVPTEAGALSAADLVFLALPAGESAAVAERLAGDVKVVDLGPDFRLGDAAQWARFYAGPHVGRWTRGLPELPGARAQIGAATRVAVPGCYATAAILALAPLLAAGLAEPDDVVIVAASGTSGAGRAPKPGLMGSEVMGSVSAYQVGGVHRHTPEIEQALAEAAAQAGARSPGAQPGARSPGPEAGAASPALRAGAASPATRAGAGQEGALTAGTGEGRRVTVSFTPMLAPMPRGILATCTARLAGGATAGAVRDALARAYEGEPFVCVLPEGRWPATAATAGSNAAHLQATADPHSGRAVVVAAIDNLGKGAAGQAVQNANLMLGLAETAGLTANGVAP